MGFMQWANSEATLFGMLWKWKSSTEDRWCVEFFTTRNGWFHAVRFMLMVHGREVRLFIFELPMSELFSRAHTDYSELLALEEGVHED